MGSSVLSNALLVITIIDSGNKSQIKPALMRKVHILKKLLF